MGILVPSIFKSTWRVKPHTHGVHLSDLRRENLWGTASHPEPLRRVQVPRLHLLSSDFRLESAGKFSSTRTVFQTPKRMEEKRGGPPCPSHWPCGGTLGSGGRHRDVSRATFYRHQSKAMDAEVRRINQEMADIEESLKRSRSVSDSEGRKRRTLQIHVEKGNVVEEEDGKMDQETPQSKS